MCKLQVHGHRWWLAERGMMMFAGVTRRCALKMTLQQRSNGSQEAGEHMVASMQLQET